MRKLLLSIAALGLMAAFATPLFAQDDDGGGGYTPPPGGPPPGGPPGQPSPPSPPPPPGGGYNPTPPPGGAGGYGGPGGPSYPGGSQYPPPTTPNPPSSPPASPPPPGPPVPPPQVPPPGGGGIPGTVPSAPSNPQPTTPTVPPTTGPGGFGSAPTTPSTVPPVTAPTTPSVPGSSGSTPGGNGILSSKDAMKKEAVDRPVGTIHIKMPTSGSTGQGSGPGTGTPPGTGGLPPGETPPGSPPGEDPPTFYGEPVEGKFCFILDASGSMAGSRIASLRAEATNTIGALSDSDEFDCMSYGTQFADSTMELWGGLQPATDGNKTAATNFVNGPACNPGGGTPTHRALEKACNIYPEDLTKMFLLTDGAPNATGSASQILAHFPAWWGKFPQECVLVCICIGGVGEAVNFMRDLAACDDSTGVFINRP